MAARRIIHVITRLDYGGSAVNTMLTVRGHDRGRFAPLVVAGCPGRWDAQGGQAATEEHCRALEKEGIPVLLLPSLVRSISPVDDVRTLWALVGLFRRERPVLVHTHTSKAGVLGRLAAWIARVPVVIHTPHGHVFYGHFGPSKSWVFLQVERLLGLFTDRMIALTDSEREDHLNRHVGKPDRFAVVPSGIDLDWFQAAKVRGKRQPAWFDCPADAMVIGSVGWLTDIKGHRYLLEAVASLKLEFPAIHLVLVGSGDQQDALLRQAQAAGISRAVHLVGHRDDVASCLAGMDVFVLPSLNEGMGRALVEAMAAGLPVIATRVGGVPALIDHGNNGLLVAPGDAQALADALRSYLRQPDLATRVGEAARRSVDARFSSSQMVRAIEALYEETLNEVGTCS